jgi:5-methylcytosine-specific restriction endonuclease McrA
MPSLPKTHALHIPPIQHLVPEDIHRFYTSTAWRRLRQMVLDDNPLCVACFKEGVIREATIVDHIKPISEGGSKLDRMNLQTLCTSCHNRKRATTDKGYYATTSRP